MKKIYFLSASDRLNFGDLLFPIIFSKLLGDSEVEFRNYGLVKSDFATFGAMKTESYRDLQKSICIDGGNLIIGGGEVLFPSWQTLYSFVSPNYASALKSYKLSKFELKHQLARRLLSRGLVKYPFSPSTIELKNSDIAIFYNSVGGEFLGSEPESAVQHLVSQLKSAKHLSLRDNRSKKSIASKGINCELAPDSALVMSDIFPKEVLHNLSTIDKSKLPKKYLFLQIGNNKAPRDLNHFGREIDLLLKSKDMNAVLCPIGLAPNHSDQIVLRKLSKLSDRFIYQKPNSIFDIILLISQSEGYLGTSLHGLITAQSFGRAIVPLNKNIAKLQAYSDTWLNEVSQGCVGYDEVDRIEGLLGNWDYGKTEKLTTSQKELVYENFESIRQKLI